MLQQAFKKRTTLFYYYIMKGNFRLKGSILLLFFSFCCLKSTSVMAQCNSGIYLIEVIKTSPGLNDGSIAVNIETTGGFECILYRISGSGYELVETIKGSSNKLIEFKNLPSYNSYVIIATFNSEDDIMCTKRQLSDLSTIEQ